MKLFVRNLAYSITEEKLREIFEAVGEVVEVKIVTDRYTGKPRGFGFVTMGSTEDAEKAIKELTDMDVDGRQIAVDIARNNARN